MPSGGQKGVRCKSPGRAHCQLNYPREDHVVDVNVLEKVKCARQEVLEHYSADFLGVRGPQVSAAQALWINSSLVPDSKYTKAASDEHLPNQLLTSNFIPADLRSTNIKPTWTYNKERYHAFTRGEVTTGWNHSTEVTRQEKRRWQQQLDEKASQATVKRTGQLKSYITLPEREEAYATTIRTQKQTAVEQQHNLVKQYGPEGAVAMQQILAMPKPDRPTVAIKPRREDLIAVQQLPPLGLADL